MYVRISISCACTHLLFHTEGKLFLMMTMDLIFSLPSPATDITATPIHISGHYLVIQSDPIRKS